MYFWGVLVGMFILVVFACLGPTTPWWIRLLLPIVIYSGCRIAAINMRREWRAMKDKKAAQSNDTIRG